jgi:hypothetical protein
MSTVIVQPGIPRTIKGLSPLTHKQLRDAEIDKCYIFNTSPREHRTTICGRVWTIPACLEGQTISEALEVPGASYYTDVKKVHGIEVEYHWVTVDGADLARDIVGTAPFRHESENMVRWGMFISDTPYPSEEVINAARDMWYARCSDKVREADDAFSVNGGMISLTNGRSVSNIGDDAREAAKVLGIEDQKPWARKNSKLKSCDECGTGNLQTAAFCKQCDNMLDEEAAKRKFPAKYAQRMTPYVASVESEIPAKRPYSRREVA